MLETTVNKINLKEWLHMHFTGCEGAPGTPNNFEATKPPTETTAFQVTGSNQIFELKRAVNKVSGDVLFEIKGFNHANVPTVSCDIDFFGTPYRVTGILTPGGPH